MKKMLSLVLSLTAISAVCSGVLACANRFTKDAIAEMAAKKKVAAAKAVLPSETAEVSPGSLPGGEEYFIGRDQGGNITGYAVTGSDPGGYGGDIVLMVGLQADKKTVVRYKTLSAAETPGLGMKLNTPEFSGQFAGKQAAGLKVRKDGGDIEAITAATITSRAVCGAVSAAAAKLR